MNHTPPRSNAPLPRFGLPTDDAADASDAVATTERPALPIRRSRVFVRKRSSRSVPPPLPPRARAASMSVASPPRPHEQAEVDDLLRHADLVGPDETQPLPARCHEPPSHETPSLAPVALSMTAPPTPWGVVPAGPSEVAPPPPRKSQLAGLAVYGILLLAVGAAAGAGAVLALPDGSLAGARETARSLAFGGAELDVAARGEPPLAEPPPPQEKVAASEPSAPALPRAPVASMPVEALPGPGIDPSIGLVTFPSRAKGHRLYVDGKLLHRAASPVEIPCGARTITIGSRGAPKAFDVPCGGELAVP